MERIDRYSEHYCFFFCSVCDSTSVNSGAYYICLSCTSRSPFIYICETCYLDDRRGLHRDCDEFDATFPKPTPASWLALPTPELDKSLTPTLPKQFLVRCVARASGTKEATLGHCFVVGDRLYTAQHCLDAAGKGPLTEVLLFDLMGGELGAWATRRVKEVIINPTPLLQSRAEDVVVFQITAGKWDNGVRLVRLRAAEERRGLFFLKSSLQAPRRPSVGERVYVMTSVGIFGGVMLANDGGLGPDDLVFLCNRSPTKDLLISGSPLVDAEGRVFGLLVSCGTMPPNRRLFAGAFLVK